MSTVKVKYLIEGMSCSGCERTVQNVIKNVKGVTFAKADLNMAMVAVEYDSSATGIDQIKSAVNGVGYKFVGELPPEDQKPGNDEAIA